MSRLIRVVDIETTGLPDEVPSAICEMGWQDVLVIDGDASLGESAEFFVNPGHPIPPKTRAIHHISDADVADACTPSEAISRLLRGMPEDGILCAHNDRFEQHFIGGNRQWIDTYRCALRAWPDAPSHSNQVLRYWHGLDASPAFETALAMPPHRSRPDAYVTAFLLMELLSLRPIERLIEISQEPGLLPKINFGKHRGQVFADLPRDYLEWMARQNDMDPDAKFTAQHWLKRGRS